MYVNLYSHKVPRKFNEKKSSIIKNMVVKHINKYVENNELLHLPHKSAEVFDCIIDLNIKNEIVKFW